MKSRFKFFSIFLSLMVAFLSIWDCNFIVYASEGVYPPGTSTLEKVIEEGTAYIMYLGCRLKAVADGDFARWIQTKEDYKEWWNTGHISSDNDGNIVFDDSLVNYIKQALTEYAEESCGFWIVPTKNFNLIGANNFTYKSSYETLKNIVKEKEIVLLGQNNYFRYMYFYDIYNYDMPFVLVCSSSNYDYEKNFGYGIPVYYYGADNWLWYAFDYYRLDFNKDTVAAESFEDLKDASYHYVNSGKYATSFYINMRPSESYNNSQERIELFSNDGRRVKVYKSLDAFKYADTNTRPVYFGSGFYDDVGEVKVSFDDLQDYLDGKYDSFFDDLKDLLPDNDASLSEDEIEKIVDKLLGQLGEVGDKVDSVDGSLKETNSILGGISDALEGIASTISGYLDSILMYLESILTDLDYIVLELQDMTEEEVNTKSDSVISELSGAFSEVGDVMSKKFPFSIPWDIKNIYVTLSGGKEPGIQSLADDIGISSLYHDNSPPSVSGGKLIDVVFYPSPADGGIMLLTADEDSGGTASVTPSGGVSFSESNAPVFTLPLVVGSAGVNASILIDMSPFDIVSEFSRTMFLLIFLYQLFLLSMRVFEFVRSFMG